MAAAAAAAATTGYASTTARRYAEAAFGIARDTGTEDQWRADLDAIAELAEHPQAAPFFASGRVSEDDKRRLLERALADLSPLAMNLARILLNRGRLTLAPQIAAAYNAMLDAERGIQHALVTTAVNLSDAERQAVARRLQELTGAREVQLETRVDPSIIGGMIVRIGDRLIDGSTRTKLVELKRSLAGMTR